MMAGIVRTRGFKARLVIAMALGTATAGALAGCSKNHGELVVDDSVGVTALRNPCPVVEVPELAGDITLFSAPGRHDAAALDVVATITHLRSKCDAGAQNLLTHATFDVEARRTSSVGARHIDLPYFSLVMRGGDSVVAKRLGTVSIDFPDGALRAIGHGRADSSVDRAEATLPDKVRRLLSRKRRAGDADAAVDPFTLPDVREALAKATFEHLVGFQLSPDQLSYNARR